MEIKAGKITKLTFLFFPLFIKSIIFSESKFSSFLKSTITKGNAIWQWKYIIDKSLYNPFKYSVPLLFSYPSKIFFWIKIFSYSLNIAFLFSKLLVQEENSLLIFSSSKDIFLFLNFVNFSFIKFIILRLIL